MDLRGLIARRIEAGESAERVDAELLAGVPGLSEEPVPPCGSTHGIWLGRRGGRRWAAAASSARRPRTGACFGASRPEPVTDSLARREWLGRATGG
jgi:hypothetical protein